MVNGHKILKAVYSAKTDSQKADDFIRSYIPFILSEASKNTGKQCTQQDDEFSIAMMAFYEAIMSYEKTKGGFLSYASVVIKSRIIDYNRKEARHRGHLSLYDECGDNETQLIDIIPDKTDVFEEMAIRDATRQEIQELSTVLKDFGICFSEIADNCPKQERTLAACGKAINYAAQNPELLNILLKTKKLPLAELVSGSGVKRKTLERHRKYILAMLLVQTNGYEIIRNHLKSVITRKEEAKV
ncbi:MAG: sigma-70 family RNA polymerase sigma factor [Ruminococcaceae bacterium]|nr:sigma-70 family RNA polymerase sigma factor [Oscillospiraceae bacterium]